MNLIVQRWPRSGLPDHNMAKTMSNALSAALAFACQPAVAEGVDR